MNEKPDLCFVGSSTLSPSLFVVFCDIVIYAVPACNNCAAIDLGPRKSLLETFATAQHLIS